MKKTAWIILLMTLIAISSASAQRYLPGMKGLQLTAGMVDAAKGYAANFAYSRYNRHGNRWITGIGILNRNADDRTGTIPVSQFTVEGGYYIKALSDRRKIFFLSVGMSALGGFETVNWGKKTLPDGGRIMERDRFVYGIAPGVEIETYLTDRLVLLFADRERMTWGGDTKKFRNELSIGIKYIIN